MRAEAERRPSWVSLTGTCRRHDVDPQRYLARLPTNLSQVRLGELPNWLPHRWKQLQPACPAEL